MEKLLHQIIVENENIKITVLSIVLAVLVIVVGVLLNWMIRKYISRTSSSEGSIPQIARNQFLIINLSIWLLAGAAILIIFSVPFKTVLEYPLIDLDKFKLKPFHFFLVAIVIIGTRILLMGLEKMIGFEKHAANVDITRRKNAFKVFSYIVWLIAVLVILNLTGLKLTVFLGAGAALLVGIGFGLQQIFADLISGLFLLFEGNLREGDVVELSNGTIGKVTHIGSRTSKVKTRDNVVQIIPNSHFISQEVINWSHIESKTRFEVSVGVAYGSDVPLVREVLLSCVEGNADISRLPKPFVRFQDFGESSLNFSLYFWSAKAFEVENIKSDVRFVIDDKFRANNIQIPFPQRDVHIIRAKGKEL